MINTISDRWEHVEGAELTVEVNESRLPTRTGDPLDGLDTLRL
jgi:hypothetical protein